MLVHLVCSCGVVDLVGVDAWPSDLLLPLDCLRSSGPSGTVGIAGGGETVCAFILQIVLVSDFLSHEI